MEEVIRHPEVYKAYRVGYDRNIGLSCEGVVRIRPIGRNIQSGYWVPTKRGPIEAKLGDWIVKFDEVTFEVYRLEEFHKQFIFKRAVSQGKYVRRATAPRWDSYVKKTGPKPKHRPKKKSEGEK